MIFFRGLLFVDSKALYRIYICFTWNPSLMTLVV